MLQWTLQLFLFNLAILSSSEELFEVSFWITTSNTLSRKTWYILHCRVIDTAASQLTKTAITVTAIFIVSLGYDSWYYLLGYAGATEYKFNSPIQIQVSIVNLGETKESQHRNASAWYCKNT